MDERTSLRVCSLIAGVICSDDEMSPDERSFLLRIVERFGLPRDIALIPITDDDAVAAELAELPEPTRWEALELLIQAAAADGKVVDSERRILGVVTAQLDLEVADIEERLRRALASS